MTRGMTAEQMNALADSRVPLKAKPMPKPKMQPAGRGTAQQGMLRMVGAYPSASTTTTPAMPPQVDHGSPRPTTTAEGAQHTAAAMAAIHGLTTLMGAMAGENNPSDITTAAVAKASPEAAALFAGSGTATAPTADVQMNRDRCAAFTAHIRRNVDGQVIDNEDTMRQFFPELYEAPDDNPPGHDD